MPNLPSPPTLAFPAAALIGALGLLLAGTAEAIIFDSTGSSTFNDSAPTSTYADSGWQWQGQFGSFLGTMIGPHQFITAQHFGMQGNTFTSTAAFNGSATVIYNIALDGLGNPIYTDIAGTDLRVVQVVETFASYATIYSSSDEVGHEMLVTGRGGPRGTDLLLDTGSGAQLKGWTTGGADGVARWGTNTVSDIVPAGFSPVGDLLQFDFNHNASANEATLSVGDSGGGIFIKQSGVWKLAGINYGTDGSFDTNNITGDSSQFSAALFDAGGYYIGSDSEGWNQLPDTGSDNPSSGYGSRLSTSAAQINAITGVPEPSSALLLAIAMLGMIRRRR
jgi:hypothetical protein